MKLIRTVLLAGAIAAVAVLAMGSTASAKTATVEVDDDFFSPASLKVKEDTRVEWNWLTENPHDVTKVSGPGKFFESGAQTGPGVMYSKTFKKPGKYKIYCFLHSDEGMRMDLKVQEKKKKNKNK